MFLFLAGGTEISSLSIDRGESWGRASQGGRPHTKKNKSIYFRIWPPVTKAFRYTAMDQTLTCFENQDLDSSRSTPRKKETVFIFSLALFSQQKNIFRISPLIRSTVQGRACTGAYRAAIPKLPDRSPST